MFSSFIIKYIHLVLSEYLLYLLISEKNVYKGLLYLCTQQNIQNLVYQKETYWILLFH